MRIKRDAFLQPDRAKMHLFYLLKRLNLRGDLDEMMIIDAKMHDFTIQSRHDNYIFINIFSIFKDTK